MVGCIKGFASLAQKENPNLVRTHCFLHREVLVSRASQENLKQVLHQVAEIVNCIKSRPIKSRLFEELCKSMCSQHVRLLMHTDVRWLSKGKVLTRFHELQKELIVFFDKEKRERFWERRMQPARGRFARFDLDRQMASTLPAHWTVGPAPVFWASQPLESAEWLALLILKAGDVESNPGP